MKFKTYGKSDFGVCEIGDDKLTFCADKDCDSAYFSAVIQFENAQDDCYIFMPACAYNGNKLKRVERNYPPMYYSGETGENFEPLMTDVPALNKDGSGKIQVTSGDMATPCVGFFNRRQKKAVLVYTHQLVKDKNVGFCVQKNRIEIQFPSNRSETYRFLRPYEKNTDKGICVKKDETVECEFKIFSFDCEDIPAFFDKFFETRKCNTNDKRAEFLYTKELWTLMENHFNEWNYSGEYYAEISKVWQCGWVGGGMSNYPLIKYGSPLSKQRGIETVDYMCRHQGKSGLYHGLIKDGIVKDDSFSYEGMEKAHLVRKSADALYFLFKNFSVVPKVKEQWRESAKKCADALCELYEKHGSFCQFVNVDTLHVFAHGTSSAAIGCAALAKAHEFFGDERYIDVARKALESYYSEWKQTGITNGGPCEILSAPDSESAFGLLESCVVLYETDGDGKWLEYAKNVAHFCSSWVVTYAYKFPENSQFAIHKINTVGSVFANVQNKHSAPGICTLSGDSLLKLYRFTGDKRYLELIKDISYFIPQCVSTRENPVYSWNNPPVALPQGHICERVNMSDWEGENRVGAVFNASCWCETSLMLSFAELMTQKEMLEE